MFIIGFKDYEDDNHLQKQRRETSMRKLLAIATVLVFVFSISSVYACGDKSGAKASTASNGSSCASKMKAEKADAGNSTVEVTTADYKVETADAKAHCAGKASATNADAASGCPFMAAHANIEKVDAKSCCAAKSAAAKATVMKVDARAKNCPATRECPVPCNKETKLENMKAEKMEKAPEISVKAVSSELAND